MLELLAGSNGCKLGSRSLYPWSESAALPFVFPFGRAAFLDRVDRWKKQIE
jgi:hypothetical protein